MLTPQNLSVQLYTLRDRFSADPEGVLAELADIGLRNVEPYDLIVYKDALTRGLTSTGLSAPTSHLNLLELSEDDAVSALDVAVDLGVGVVVQPVSEAGIWTDTAAIRELAGQLNRLSTFATERGVAVGYHNHWFELENVFNGRYGLEVLADHLVEEVVIEVDTYWAFVGGADVVSLLERLGGRVTAIHLKDGDGVQGGRQCAAGQGVVPMLDYVAVSDALQWAVIELDGFDGDVTQAVRESFDYFNGK